MIQSQPNSLNTTPPSSHTTPHHGPNHPKSPPAIVKRPHEAAKSGQISIAQYLATIKEVEDKHNAIFKEAERTWYQRHRQQELKANQDKDKLYHEANQDKDKLYREANKDKDKLYREIQVHVAQTTRLQVSWSPLLLYLLF